MPRICIQGLEAVPAGNAAECRQDPDKAVRCVIIPVLVAVPDVETSLGKFIQCCIQCSEGIRQGFEMLGFQIVPDFVEDGCDLRAGLQCMPHIVFDIADDGDLQRILVDDLHIRQEARADAERAVGAHGEPVIHFVR